MRSELHLFSDLGCSQYLGTSVVGGLFFRLRAMSAITTILGFSISAIFGSHGNSANLVPLPPPIRIQIGVAFTHIIPGSSQIGVDFRNLTSIGVHFRG